MRFTCISVRFIGDGPFKQNLEPSFVTKAERQIACVRTRANRSFDRDNRNWNILIAIMPIICEMIK